MEEILIQKIYIVLKMIERCLINKIQQIELELYIRSNNENRQLDRFFKSKHKDWLIERLKTIKYKEDIFSYLSSYTNFIFFA